MPTPEQINARKTCCRNDAVSDPNFYKNNKYISKGAEALKQKRELKGVTRVSEYDSIPGHLIANTSCVGTNRCTSNYKLKESHRYPARGSLISRATENEHSRGIPTLGLYGFPLPVKTPSYPPPTFPEIGEPEEDTPILNAVATLQPLISGEQYGTSIAMAPDGERIVVGAPSVSKVYIYDKNHSLLDTIIEPSLGIGSAVDVLKFSSQGYTYVVGADATGTIKGYAYGPGLTTLLTSTFPGSGRTFEYHQPDPTTDVYRVAITNYIDQTVSLQQAATGPILIGEPGSYHVKIFGSVCIVSATNTYIMDVVLGTITKVIAAKGKVDVNATHVVIGNKIYSKPGFTKVQEIQVPSSYVEDVTPVALLPNDMVIIGHIIYDISTGDIVATLATKGHKVLEYFPVASQLFTGDPSGDKIYIYDMSE